MGAGISEEDLVDLFEAFKQGQSAKQTEAKGTGLGLAITYKIITNLHNGEIIAKSELKKGTCFYITL